MGQKSKNNILYHGLGDWYDLGPKHPGEAQLTPKAVTATTIYYYDLTLVAKVAALLNRNVLLEARHATLCPFTPGYCPERILIRCLITSLIP